MLDSKNQTHMKVLKNIFAILFIIGMSSCGEDFLDIDPQDALPPDNLQTVDDLATLLQGAYDQLQDTDWYGRYFVLAPDIMSDDVKQNSQANRGKDWAEYNGSVNDIHAIPENTWTEIYEGINRTNTIINAEIDVPPAVQDDYNQIVGEAHALRALAHFDLVRFYAQHYGFTADNSHPGVPVVTTFDQTALPGRNTVAQVYDAVISDLNQAITLMNSDEGRGRFSQEAAQALLARVSLYQSDWAKAEAEATKVIDSGIASLTPTNDYVAQWSGIDFSPDALFDVVNTAQDNFGSEALSGMYVVEGYGDYLPAQDVVSLIDPADVRIQLFREDPDLVDPFGPIRVAKYPNPQGFDNRPVIRLAEVYLIRAEARARQGNSAGAIEDLMTIRRRAWPDAPDVNLEGDALLDEIAKEKRIELMFEGHRLWELMRHQQGVFRQDCTAPTGACEIPYPDNRFILPIPIQELNVNPNIEQNPGY